MSEILKMVNWVDVFVLILLIRILYVSSNVGVGKQILPLILLVLILLLTLYYYGIVASYIDTRTFIAPAMCKAVAYFSMLFVFAVIYRIAARVTGVLVALGEGTAGPIEKIGGAILGFVRSFFIIGLVLIGFLLFPNEALRTSVKDSYSGILIADLNIKTYNQIVGLISRYNGTSNQKELSEFLMEKE